MLFSVFLPVLVSRLAYVQDYEAVSSLSEPMLTHPRQVGMGVAFLLHSKMVKHVHFLIRLVLYALAGFFMLSGTHDMDLEKTLT
jgi:hypothetical protein